MDRGFTLVELIVVTSIISILCVLAIPSYLHSRKIQEASNFHVEFYSAYQQGRAAVLVYRQPIVICGTSNINQLCDHNWNKGIAVFIDTNNNAQHDANERVLSYVPTNIRFGEIKLKISLNRRVVKLSMDRGLVYGYFGKLLYCTNEPTLIRAVIWGAMGNLRLAQDSNGDGIRDDDGTAINCS